MKLKLECWEIIALCCFLFATGWALADVPDPVRSTSYDWRCVHENGTLVSNHTRQDQAIVACQNAAEASPGTTYFIEGGRYRVRVDGVPTPPPEDPDIVYSSTSPSGDSVLPGLPSGTPVRVWVLAGSGVEVRPNGSMRAQAAEAGRVAVEVSYQNAGVWSAREMIEWVL